MPSNRCDRYGFTAGRLRNGCGHAERQAARLARPAPSTPTTQRGAGHLQKAVFQQLWRGRYTPCYSAPLPSKRRRQKARRPSGLFQRQKEGAGPRLLRPERRLALRRDRLAPLVEDLSRPGPRLCPPGQLPRSRHTRRVSILLACLCGGPISAWPAPPHPGTPTSALAAPAIFTLASDHHPKGCIRNFSESGKLTSRRRFPQSVVGKRLGALWFVQCQRRAPGRRTFRPYRRLGLGRDLFDPHLVADLLCLR